MDRTPRRASHEWNTRCKAHSKATGLPCGKWAMAGQTVCRSHGGAANKDRGLARVERERAMQNANRLAGRFLATYGVDVDEALSPYEQLMGSWRRAITLAAAYRALIDATDPDLLLEGRLGKTLNPVVEAWQNAEKQAFDFGAQIAKLGIEDRRMRVEEAHLRALAEVTIATLADHRLGLTIEQQQAGRRVFAERIRSLDAEPVGTGRLAGPSAVS